MPDISDCDYCEYGFVMYDRNAKKQKCGECKRKESLKKNKAEMIKCKWVAYGLDMALDYVIIETEGSTIKESHNKAVKLFTENKIDFDTVEMVNTDFLRRSGILKEESLDDLLKLRSD